MKLDAKFYGVIVKAKDGSILADDEYVVFLAKDTAFANILPAYLAECKALGCDEEQIAAVGAMIGRLREWRTKNSNRLKRPDAKDEHLLV